jgi:hypothetical protein
MSRLKFLTKYAVDGVHYDSKNELTSLINGVTHDTRYDAANIYSDHKNLFDLGHVDAAINNPHFAMNHSIQSDSRFKAHPKFKERVERSPHSLNIAIRSGDLYTDNEVKKFLAHQNLHVTLNTTSRLFPNIGTSQVRNPAMTSAVEQIHAGKDISMSPDHTFAFDTSGTGTMKPIGAIAHTDDHIDHISVLPGHDFEKVASVMIQSIHGTKQTTASVHPSDTKMHNIMSMHGFKSTGQTNPDGTLMYHRKNTTAYSL